MVTQKLAHDLVADACAAFAEHGDFRVLDIAARVGAQSYGPDSVTLDGHRIELDGSNWHDMGSQYSVFKQWTPVNW